MQLVILFAFLFLNTFQAMASSSAYHYGARCQEISCSPNSKFASYLPIHGHEAANDLQKHLHSSLAFVLTKFSQKGGTIIRLEGDITPYPLLPGDLIFPSCSGGNNRSQTLWNVLRPFSHKIFLMPPHATQYGFDPFNGQANWSTVSPTQKNDEFILWAGVAKAQKFGWENFTNLLTKTEATTEELAGLLDYYNRYYYNPVTQSGTRRIYITFAKNAHIHLYRLCQTNTSLENVVVLFFPIEDLIKAPLPHWNTYPRSVKSYHEFAKILVSYLDFSQIH